MSTYVVLSVPAEEMILAEATRELPEAYCYVEQSAMSRPDNSLNIWIACEGCEDLPAVLEADSSVADFEKLREEGIEELYAIEIERSMLMVRELVHEHDGTIMEAYGTSEGWTLEIRFPSREALSETSEAFEEYDIDSIFESIKADADSLEERRNDLTDGQRDLLETAIESGYFSIPRSTTLEELAEQLDVSHQSLSEQLRRAQKKLATDRIRKRSHQTVSEEA